MPAWSETTSEVLKLTPGAPKLVAVSRVSPLDVRNDTTSVRTCGGLRKDPRSTATPRSKTRPTVTLCRAATTESGLIAPPHNTHNTQNSVQTGVCAGQRALGSPGDAAAERRDNRRTIAGAPYLGDLRVSARPHTRDRHPRGARQVDQPARTG